MQQRGMTAPGGRAEAARVYEEQRGQEGLSLFLCTRSVEGRQDDAVDDDAAGGSG